MYDDFCGGFYQVGDKTYTSKFEACNEASVGNLPVIWRYFDNVWQQASTPKPWKPVDLRDLYRRRAQQIRDKHQYLILSYSGGSDSWTILRAFLDNNIFIDEIVVNWPAKATQGPDAIHKYEPNTDDKSPVNYLSEWDECIKGDLEAIVKASPHTKITIQDWSELILTDPPAAEEVLTKPTFHALIQQRIIGIKTADEIAALDQGKSVGYIYGADKPRLYKRDSLCYFHFSDGSVRHNVSPSTYGTTIEYFFMSPDMPEVAVETARAMFTWFNEGNTPMLILDELWKREHWIEYIQLTRQVTRPDYDLNRFQTSDPVNKGLNIDKYSWVRPHPKYTAAFERWDAIMAHHYSFIDKQFLLVDDNDIGVGLKQSMSVAFVVGEFTTK